jgi:hypothetical protein
MFEVALNSEDGRVRITRADTGRVTIALTLDEASQLRAGLKKALQSADAKRSKKGPKHSKRP